MRQPLLLAPKDDIIQTIFYGKKDETLIND